METLEKGLDGIQRVVEKHGLKKGSGETGDDALRLN